MGKKYKKTKLLSVLIKDKKVENRTGSSPNLTDEIIQLQSYLQNKKGSLLVTSATDLNRDILEAMADLAVDLWKLEQRLKAQENKIDEDICKSLRRPLDSAMQKLKQKGIEIVDRTNDRYDSGMIEKVLTIEERPGSSFDIVAETIKPTIYYMEAIIGIGEIIVGTPPALAETKQQLGGEACAQPSTLE